MGIFHFSVKIIGRGSGRSAVGASAYRAGEKLRLVEKAAYRSGEALRDEDVKMTHDYTKKGGVVHKEILLPDGAPKEFENRETLWNFVEARERRKDAQLARELEIALQTEFTLQENIDLLREYLEENFVEKGMIADFVLHNNHGNPHAHVMLTMRHVTPEGFGNKNREWDKKANLLIWRENWAKINNSKFEEKGLNERIDHRTLEAQGIDREPTIHMGHEAWALEKKGIKTEKGDYNREVQRRNDERAVKTQEQNKDDQQDENATAAANATSGNKPSALKKGNDEAERSALMSAKRNLREIEEHLKAEKASQIVGKLQEDREARREAEKTARHMIDLKENYIDLDKELSTILRENESKKQEIWQLDFLADNMDEHAKNIEIMRSKAAELQTERQKLTIWEGKRKKEKDAEIEQALGNIRVAQHNFKKDYAIDPEQAPTEIKRTQEKIRENKDALNKNTVRILEIKEHQAAIELEYRTQKLLNELRPDKEQIEKSLEKLNKTPESVREKLRQNEITHRLNTITKETFQKIIENLPDPQAQPLTKLREEKEAELLKQAKKDRAITIERDR